MRKVVFWSLMRLLYILYCPLVWHLCSATDSKRLENVLERALRYVLNDFDSLYNDMLKKASVTSDTSTYFSN